MNQSGNFFVETDERQTLARFHSSQRPLTDVPGHQISCLVAHLGPALIVAADAAFLDGLGPYLSS